MGNHQVPLHQGSQPGAREVLGLGQLRGAIGVLALLTGACHSAPASPQAAAERFIDAYYIERDHPKALVVATARAAERVSEEAKLVSDGRAAGAGSSAVQPHVYYNLEKQTPRGDQTELEVLLTIDSGGVQLKKRVRLLVVQQGSEFKVGSFSEADLPQ